MRVFGKGRQLSLPGLVDAAAFTGVWMTLAACLGPLDWSLEIFTHVTPQLAACFAGYGVYRLLVAKRRAGGVRVAAGSFLLAAVNAAFVAPRLPAPAQDGARARRTVRVLQANVLTGNRDATRLLNLVEAESPDVILLQETDGGWLERLAPLTNRYPVAAAEARTDNFGTAAFAKTGTADILHFSDAEQSPCARVEIPSERGPVTLLGIHPLAPKDRREWTGRDALLAEIARYAADRPRVVVMGDFNTTPYTRAYHAFERESGLVDANLGRLPLPTWHAGFPPFLRIPLDHCLYSRDLHAHGIRRGPDIGSDHFPLIFEFSP